VPVNSFLSHAKLFHLTSFHLTNFVIPDTKGRGEKKGRRRGRKTKFDCDFSLRTARAMRPFVCTRQPNDIV
jgi:hypothetical protein